MNTIAAFAIGQAYQGNELKVFDWDKAAKLIKESKTNYASAGLDEDWEWTGGVIYKDNKPVTDSYTYLSSTWATPKLCINDEFIDCYKMWCEVPDWNAETKWPESALKILNEEKKRMKDYSILDELVPKTQELHRTIFDKGYEQGQKDILEQLCYDDCISRQAVLEVLKKNRYRFNISQEGYCEGKVLWSENLIKDDACKEIEQLPLIMPTKKTGKWTEQSGGDPTDSNVSCSLCNKWFHQSTNYCPNCGAKMIKSTESEDKE